MADEVDRANDLAQRFIDADALWVIITGMLGVAGMRSVEKVKGVAR